MTTTGPTRGRECLAERVATLEAENDGLRKLVGEQGRQS